MPDNNFFSQLLEFLGRVLEQVKNLPKTKQAAIVALILVVAAAALVVLFLPAQSLPFGLLCLAIVAAVATFLLTKPVAGIAILVFSLLAFMVVPRGPAPTPVPQTTDKDLEVLPLSGTVRNDAGQKVADAQITINGLGAPTYSDGAGAFALEIKRYMVKDDTVEMHIETMLPDTALVFRRRYSRYPYELRVPRQVRLASQSAGALEDAAVATASVFGGLLSLLRSHDVGARQTPTPTGVRVILDSIRPVADGSVGATDWTFGISLNDSSALRLARTGYNDRVRSARRIGEEVRAFADARGLLRIGIDGSRSGDLLSLLHPTARGSAAVPVANLVPGRPIAVPVRVTVPGQPQSGDFMFFYTLVRQGGPPLQARRVQRR